MSGKFVIAGDFGVILGDSGYALRRYLMTPFIEMHTEGERKFNKAHKKTRIRVECALGILKNHFQCLMKPLRVVGHEASANVILATIVLHNMAIANMDYYRPLLEGLNVRIQDEIIGDNTNTEGRRVRQYTVDNYFS